MSNSVIKPRNIFFFISALYLLSCVIAMIVLSVLDKDVITIKSIYSPQAAILTESGLNGKLYEIDEEIDLLLLEENISVENGSVRSALKLENRTLTALDFSRRSHAKEFKKQIESRGFYAEINKNIVTYSIASGYESLLSGGITKEGTNYIFSKDNSKILLKGDSVPSSVTAIGMRAFASSSIKEIALNTNINRIHPQAFMSSKLEKVTGEVSGLNIDNAAFFGCVNLTDFSVTGSVSVASENAFSECTSLKVLSLKGVKTIEKNALYGCRSLENVDFGEDSNYILAEENMIFTKDKAVILKYFGKAKTVSLPSETKTIAASAFSRLAALESVTTSGAIEKIEDSAFESCFRYTNAHIAKDASVIGSNAFINTKVSEVSFSDNLTSIGDNAFRLTSIKEVTIPVAVKSIGSYAFKDAVPLRRVNILGSSPFAIGDEVFDGIYRLYVSSANEFKDSWENYANFIYSFSSISGEFSAVEKNDGMEISQYLGSAENIIIPKTLHGKPVTSIGVRAFSKLSFIKDVHFESGSSVETISDYAFEASTGIKTIVMPSGLKTIGRDAFRTCISLENISIPNSVNKIGGYSFESTPWQNNGTGFVVVGNGILYRYMSKNSDITVPSGVKQIGERAFMNCTSVISINMPKSLEIVQSYAFLNCSNLVQVNFSEGIHTLGDSLFSGCGAMKEIVLPKSIEYLGYMSFYKLNFSRITVLNPKPFKLGYQVFHYMTDWSYKLVVPKGTLCENQAGKCGFVDKNSCYRHASGWAAYKKNIVEAE